MFAALTAYGQPFDVRASVSVLVTDPKGVDNRRRLTSTGAGRFNGTVATSIPGVYTIRFLAVGGRGKIGRFQREDTRTVCAYRGEIPKGEGNPGDDKDRRRIGGGIGLSMSRRSFSRNEHVEASEMNEPITDGDRDDLAAFGFVEQPTQDPAGNTGARARGDIPADHAVGEDPAGRDGDHQQDVHTQGMGVGRDMNGHDMEGHGGTPGGHDHENMSFTMFRRTSAGGVQELQAGDIARDTSDYDEKGQDPGAGQERVAPPDQGAHHDHDH